MSDRIVGYVRVSTDEQASTGVSLDAQTAAIQAYCAMRRLEVSEIVVDAGVSAGKPLASRDGGRRVLDLVRSGNVGAVVAFKLDRVFRDCADCLAVVRDWDRRGISLHLVDLGGQTVDTGTAMGRFFLTVMAGAAELERNLVGERTKAALAHLKANGVRLGRDALGWQRTDASDERGRRILTDLADETVTVHRIVALHRDGLTLRAIAERLAREGHRTKRGGRWHASTVRAVLRRHPIDIDRTAPEAA